MGADNIEYIEARRVVGRLPQDVSKDHSSIDVQRAGIHDTAGLSAGLCPFAPFGPLCVPSS